MLHHCTEGIKIKRLKWFLHNSESGLGRIWSFRQNHQHLISMKLPLSVLISRSGQKDLKTSKFPGLRASCPMAGKTIMTIWRSSQAKTLAMLLPDRWEAWSWHRLRLAMLGRRQIVPFSDNMDGCLQYFINSLRHLNTQYSRISFSTIHRLAWREAILASLLHTTVTIVSGWFITGQLWNSL